MPPVQEADISLRSAQLAGGISQQPPHLRYPGQVEAALNVVFDVADGIRRRSGRVYVKRVSGLTAGYDYQIETIDRDENEKYAIVYGDGGTVLRVFDRNGVEATVTISSDAATYLALNSPTTAQLKFRSVGDYTLIVNTTVPTALADGATYTVTQQWRDYDVMTSNTPANNTYHQSLADVTGQPAGYFLYSSGSGTFGTYRFTTITGADTAPSGVWDDAGQKGFSLRFQRRSRAFTGTASYVAATRTLTATGCFTQYVFDSRDDIYIEAGTSTFASGWYRIESKVDSDHVVLAPSGSLPGANTNGMGAATGSIGIKFDVHFDATSGTLPDMFAVAAFIETALHTAGAMDALCSWTSTGTSQGYFTITNPWSGNGTDIVQIGAPSTGTDLTAAGQAFSTASGVDTVGTGSGNRTLPVDQRWTRVSAPGDQSSTLDPTKMPVQMVRTVIGPPATFTVNTITWNQRVTGSLLTNPAPSIFTNGLAISDIAFYRDRLGLSGGENTVWSRDGDLFNYFVADPSNLVDSDPIDVSLSSDRVTNIDFMVPFRTSVYLFTLAGQQFSLREAETFTANTVSFTTATGYNTQRVRPVTTGGLLYMLGTGDTAGQMFEAYYDDVALSTEATEVSSHVPDLLPTTVRRMAAHANTRQVVSLSSDGLTLTVYRTHWTGTTKQQSAWTLWQFDGSEVVQGITIIKDDLWLLVQRGSQLALEKMTLMRPTTVSGIPFALHADRQFTLTGVFSAGVTTWTLPDSMTDTSLNAIVLGSAFGGSAGTILTPDTAGGTTVTKSGNYSAGAAVVCRKFTSSGTFTRPYFRDQRGAAELDTGLLCKRVTTTHKSSGPYTLTQDRLTATDINYNFTPVSAVDTGTFRAFIAGDVELMSVKFATSDVRPLTLTGLEHQVDVMQPLR